MKKKNDRTRRIDVCQENKTQYCNVSWKDREKRISKMSFTKTCFMFGTAVMGTGIIHKNKKITIK